MEKRKKSGSAYFLFRLTEGGADEVLVQEPLVVGGNIAGIVTKEYKLMLDFEEAKIRSCILAKRHLSIFLLRFLLTASVALLHRLTEGGADLVLVPPKEGKIRTCILAKSHLSIFLLRNYSNGDSTAVSLALEKENPQMRWSGDWQRNAKSSRKVW